MALLVAGVLTAASIGAAQTRSGTPADPEITPGFRTEEIRLGSGSATLAGTLVVPEVSGRSPAVIIVSGSGPNDRYGHIRRFPAYGIIAEHLARSGTAVLLLDRRGVGGSAGHWQRERIEDRTRDVLSAVAWLRTRPEIDSARVGILGHSQGGWVAQLAAARSREVSFVILMAGPGESVRQQILTDERNEPLRTGHSPEEVERRVRSLNRWLGVADAIAPVCRLARLHPVCYTVEYDPAPALARIQAPVLALFAELDPMVPPEPNVQRIREGLQQAGNSQLSVRIFEGANHQFWKAITGARAEYAQLRPAYVPGFLDVLSDWIASTSSQPGAP